MTKRKKTWGREIATFVLLWFMFYIVPMKDIEYVEILVLPVFSLWTLSFGLKRITSDTELLRPTQLTHGGRPQYSSEYPSGQGKYSDDRSEFPTEVRPQSDNGRNHNTPTTKTPLDT